MAETYKDKAEDAGHKVAHVGNPVSVHFSLGGRPRSWETRCQRGKPGKPGVSSLFVGRPSPLGETRCQFTEKPGVSSLFLVRPSPGKGV